MALQGGPSGAGLQATGGATGNGAYFLGGSTSGHGILVQAATAGSGLMAQAGGGNPGMYLSGEQGLLAEGVGGGIYAFSEGSSALTLHSYGTEDSPTVSILCQNGGESHAVQITSDNGAGVYCVGTTGFQSHGTAGNGLLISSADNTAILAVSQSGNNHGMSLQGSGTGYDLDATLGANAITATSIATGAITAAKFDNNAITSSVIADGAIDADTLASGTITSSTFASGAITEASTSTDYKALLERRGRAFRVL